METVAKVTYFVADALPPAHEISGVEPRSLRLLI
jgi:hypothetical protein